MIFVQGGILIASHCMLHSQSFMRDCSSTGINGTELVTAPYILTVCQ